MYSLQVSKDRSEMTYSLILLLSVIPIGYLNSHILNAEGIQGGHPAFQPNFQYIVAIVARQNFSAVRNLVCTGSILADFFIATAAHCFLSAINGNEVSYAIVAGTSSLLSREAIIINVNKIYIPLFDSAWPDRDFAVAKVGSDWLNKEFGFRVSTVASVVQVDMNELKEKFHVRIVLLDFQLYQDDLDEKFRVRKLDSALDLINNQLISKITVAPSKTVLIGREGTVAGFGAESLNISVNAENGQVEKIDGVSNFTLKYIFVKVFGQQICRNKYHTINTRNEICGITIGDRPNDQCGICLGDGGSPLVMDEGLVGLASVGIPNCDDTYYGTVYTKVSPYSRIIREIISGKDPYNIAVYYNRPFIPPLIS